MAWLEQAFDEAIHVVVVEARGTAVWMRTGRRGKAGKRYILVECETATEAVAAAAARIAELVADGYEVLDPEAGLDAEGPVGRT